jgi:hypothetical protein
MKPSIILIAGLICSMTNLQVATAQVVMGPQTEYLGIPGGLNRSGVVNYNHYDLNQNIYNGGTRDITEIDRVIPFTEKYSYEDFLNGHLIYTSGNKSQIVKMNFHLLYGEMQFIGPAGDTLFIANADTIAYVRFDKDLYQHDSKNGYVKILSGNYHIKLCTQKKLELNQQVLRSNNNVNVQVEHLILSKKDCYYLFEKGVKYEANKSGFEKAFPQYKQQIEGYLQQMARQRMPIKFYIEDHLVGLMNFCTSLI